MKRSQLLASLTMLSASACFVDAVGLELGAGAGGATTTTSGTTDAGPTTNGTGGLGGSGEVVGGGGAGGAGGGGVTTTGGGGGEGPTGCTIDGAIDVNETCEDGNLAANDGCDSTCQLEATCGNGVPEGGEPCDDGTVCDDSCLGSCQAGTFLTAGATVSGNTSGGIGAFDCGISTGTMRAYRIATSPHPEGILVLATNANNSFDPVLAVARDCSATPLCDNALSWQSGLASVRTPILPPSTQLVVGVADDGGNDSGFEVYYRPYRYFDEFTGDPAGWTLGEWDSNGSALNTWYDGPGFADSPDIYVGGIQTVRVSFPYEISSTAGAQVSASWDGGAFSVEKQLPAAPNDNFDEVDGTFTLQRPTGASRLRLRFEYLGDEEGIIIPRLEVGPDVPGPAF